MFSEAKARRVTQFIECLKHTKGEFHGEPFKLLPWQEKIIVNQMLLKHRAKLEASQKAMEEAQARMQAEQENAKATKAQVDELLSWAECFDKADIGTKHLIVSRLIERVEVRTGYKMHIKFKISLKQFLGQE